MSTLSHLRRRVTALGLAAHSAHRWLGNTRFARSRSGVAAIEFALVVPIMFLLFVGSIEFSQAITVDRRVTQVASSTADLVARTREVNSGDVDGIMRIVDHLMWPYEPGRLRLTLVNVIGDPNNTAVGRVLWSYNHTNGGVNTYSARDTYSLPSGITEACDSVIISEVRYLYDPLIFNYFIESTFPLEEVFYLKPRLSARVDNTDTSDDEDAAQQLGCGT